MPTLYVVATPIGNLGDMSPRHRDPEKRQPDRSRGYPCYPEAAECVRHPYPAYQLP